MRALIIACAAAIALFVGCASPQPSTTASQPSESTATRTVAHADGTAEVPANPQRIVSTSVTLTGSLLALDAPVVGSGGSVPNGVGLDSHGWFTHWSAIAEERGVESLYTGGNVDLEAIVGAEPDVILVSATGGDSAMDNLDQLKEIAPTLVVDYNSQSWEDVTRQLGDMLNLTENADRVLREWDELLNTAKNQVAAPQESVNIAVYNAETGLSVGLPTAPQALILSELGFTVADTGATAEEGRSDFAFTTVEQANQYLTADRLLLVGNSQADVDALLADDRFATLPAVQAKQVSPLGIASFKLDYYAAQDLVEHVGAAFPK